MRFLNLHLPYTGVSYREELFQYFLLKITTHSALIAFPSWLVGGTYFSESQKVNLLLEGLLFKKSLAASALIGTSALHSNQFEKYGDLYRIVFDTPLSGGSLLYKGEMEKFTEEETNCLALELIKDSLLIKEGLNVYFKHLIPFLSRIISMDEVDYKQLKDVLLVSVRDKIQHNISYLNEIYLFLNERKNNNENLFYFLDLEQLRSIFDSEIDNLLFRLALGGQRDVLNIQLGAIEEYSLRSYKTYLKSIKTLEHRLYSNLNTLTYLYAFCIEKVFKI